jgi:hypothetical protein
MTDVAIDEPSLVGGFKDVGEELDGDEDFYLPTK